MSGQAGRALAGAQDHDLRLGGRRRRRAREVAGRRAPGQSRTRGEGSIRVLSLAVTLLGCRVEAERDSNLGDRPLSLELEEIDQAVRASLSLRGLRPTEDELAALVEGRSSLPELVDTWLESPAFGEVVKDLHAERLLLRTDTDDQLPVLGILASRGYNQAEVYQATVEAPLELIKEVVTTDRPYGEILTVDYTLANEVVADIYGLPYDRAVGGWQRTRWTDGRPQSGLLSDSQIWRRHVSNAANFHRGRANFVSQTFLCEDIGGRDVFVEGGVDISDELAVAEAVNNDPGCLACHAVLDPLAAFFWGYKEQLKRGAILGAYDLGCEWDWTLGEHPRGSYRVEHWCYPLRFYGVDDAEGWRDWGLRGPAYFGQPARDVRDLGWLIREDHRFATCTARSAWAYFAQARPEDAPPDIVAELARGFVDSDQSWKRLARSIVLHPTFHRVDAEEGLDAVGLLSLRPEAWSRSVAAATGFVWWADPDFANCATVPNNCWGPQDLATSDLIGFRAMFGGVDSLSVTHALHTVTPTKVLALQRMAQEAAGFVVDGDFALADPASRRLLREVEPTTRDEAAVRLQLVALHVRLLSWGVSKMNPTVRDISPRKMEDC